MVCRVSVVVLLATLAAACGGDSPTSPSKSVANYAGNWTGTYTITGCNQTGGVALANVCGLLGSTPSYSMALTQSGSNVAGTFTLGTITFPNTGGAVGQDGSLALNATSISNGINIVVSWNLRMASNIMSGTISQNWTSNSLSGSAVVAGTIATANR